MTKDLNLSLVERAREFATMKHNEIGQVRKYTGEPYICHPEAVVALVKTVPHTDEMLAAAWLHDTVEDTNCSFSELERLFGSDVASLVEMLTDVSKPEDGNRAVRKAIDRAHTATATPEAKTIKLADLLDNSVSIIDNDPRFAKVYMKEKELLLEVLTEGDPTLWKTAQSILQMYKINTLS